MKWFISGWAFLILGTFGLMYQHNYHFHQEQIHHLKYVSQEAAAGATQYFSKDKYGDGYLVYNKVEGQKAANAIVRDLLKLNEDMSPTEKTYWKQSGKIKVDLIYFDEENYSFPYTYTYEHPNGDTDFIMYGPSVIVKIEVGKAKYGWLDNEKSNYRIGMHTFEE